MERSKREASCGAVIICSGVCLLLLNHSPMNASVTAQHYHSDLGRKLEDMKVLVNELQDIMPICEAGREKEEFSTEGFAPALLASNSA